MLNYMDLLIMFLTLIILITYFQIFKTRNIVVYSNEPALAGEDGLKSNLITIKI